jgi:glutamine amidotransferase
VTPGEGGAGASIAPPGTADTAIVVLDYGIGNLRSAEKALAHLGAPVRLVDRPADVDRAAGVVLPGVGHFASCAAALSSSGLGAAAVGAIERGVPFLGICVGFQLLYEGSEESPDVPGLAVLPGRVRRLAPGVKHPQMQWNSLARAPRPDSGLLAGLGDAPWVYFVPSFAPPIGEDTVAVCDYGGPVGAAAERGNVWGTQFHPEKSGSVGLAILSNFVARCTTDRVGGPDRLRVTAVPGAS